ncbi:MAG TPA: archease [Usitatibacter sp.]
MSRSRALAPADYGYFDHDADVGVIGRGKFIESAFVAAARAVFALISDIGAIARRERIPIEFEEADVELALVRWLNLLLAHAAERGLALGEFALQRDGARWKGEAWGERWREGLERGTDVKGATLTMLSVAQRGSEGWEARCVVDV